MTELSRQLLLSIENSRVGKMHLDNSITLEALEIGGQITSSEQKPKI